MIGLVVVSHSRALAQAAVDLALEMVDEADRPAVKLAAGLDETTFGTDAAAVAEAITAVDTTDGVLVLLDLGSAVMSAEMALEFLEPEAAARVRLSSAPLVEGLVAAVVTAASGATLHQVSVEAERGLAAKVGQLGGVAATAAGQGDDEGVRGQDADADDALVDGEMTREVRVGIPHGLHARPAAAFVGCVNRFAGAEVRARNPQTASGWVSAGSLSAVATLNVRQGQLLELRAAGEEAQVALDALEELARAEFSESVVSAQPAPQGQGQDEAPSPTEPLPMGSGLDMAAGPLQRRGEAAEVSDYVSSGETATERERLQRALDQADAELADLVATTRAGLGGDQAEVFVAHRAWVRDPEITGPAFAGTERGEPAGSSWEQAGISAAEKLAQVDDDYLRERAEDIRSVTRRVLRLLVALSTTSDTSTAAETPSSQDVDGSHKATILLVSELDPGTAVSVDPRHVGGIVTTAGGSTGHGVLLAQARGIPTITGRSEVSDVESGTWVAFDTRRQMVWVDPDGASRAEIDELGARREHEQERERAAAREPARTRDGTRVSVNANVTSSAEAQRAVELGAEGSGLVRTEVLFESWRRAPTVSEQTAALWSVAAALGGRPMTVRTWDIGADKPLSFWQQEPEQNPFLGVRGIRSFAAHADVLHDQLRAVCRVAAEHPVRVMFPMVATVSEVRWALRQLDLAVEQETGARPDGLEVGIMVEVPAAALRVAAMTEDLDFVSIGTNDLTQYTLAAERGNAAVEHLFDPMDPAVLRLIRGVCLEARERVEVSVCGGAASDPAAACLLVGLGVDELSATAVAVPRVKAELRRHTVTQLRQLGEQALGCDSAEAVHALLEELTT
ncbi:MAG: phosphoenolpyruvate--protein phosphotransferase [Ornithinimicrobium sp.]